MGIKRENWTLHESFSEFNSEDYIQLFKMALPLTIFATIIAPLVAATIFPTSPQLLGNVYHEQRRCVRLSKLWKNRIQAMGSAERELITMFDKLTGKAAYLAEFQEELEFVINLLLLANRHKKEGKCIYPAYERLFRYLNSERFINSPRCKFEKTGSYTPEHAKAEPLNGTSNETSGASIFSRSLFPWKTAISKALYHLHENGGNVNVTGLLSHEV